MATQKQRDRQKAELYLKKLEVARQSTSVNPFETREETEARIARAREDVAYMVKTYFPKYAEVESAPFQIDFASAVANDPLFKGFAEWGRGLAKSVWCNIFIPIWLWMRGEDVFMCLMSDSEDRADELLADVQAELDGNPLIVHDFGSQKAEGDWEVGNFKTIDHRFIGMAFGVKQKVRGLRVRQRRPNLWVIDDLETPDTISNPKRMSRQARHIEADVMGTMVADRRRILYANNRFARVMTQTMLQERHPEWKVFQVKAYNKVTYEPAWKARYDAGFYRQQEKDMGIVAAYAEYNHEHKIEGKIFSEEQIQWTDLPDLTEFKMIVAHWDIAYAGNETSDYNAIKVWGLKDRNFFLIDCYVKQSKMLPAVMWLADFKKSLPEGVNFIAQYESQFWNGEVQRSIDDAEETAGIYLNLMKCQTPKTNKLGRMITMQPYYQNSRIYYNAKLKSHNDTQVGIIQLCAVEEGSTEHDDSPDADQQALAVLDKYDTPVKKVSGEKSWRVGKFTHKYEW